MKLSTNLIFLKITTCIILSFADISHFFPTGFQLFPTQQNPFQFVFPVSGQTQQSALNNFYAAPEQQHQQQQQQQQQQHFGYPVASAPAPVAPTTATTTATRKTTTTTEFFLPEIVENRNAKNHIHFIPLQSQYLPPDVRPQYESPKPPNQSSGYFYPRPIRINASYATSTEYPLTPIVVAEQPEFSPTPPPPQPQPPAFINDVVNEQPAHQGYDYNVPDPIEASTPGAIYLPPAQTSHSVDTSSLSLDVKEMRCLYHHNGYFRAILKVNNFIAATPNVDTDSQDKRCELKLSRSFVIIDIAKADFHACGVQPCGKDLCLRLRFPTIQGMRTGADGILTLHCKTQDHIVMKTHALKMGVANDIQARSIGTYAHGGAQNPFRTHVELLRKTNNGFTRHVETHGTVQLGEELLLRAHVLTGDGWNYTKLTDVDLQRISPSGELLNSANLIASNGCINPAMQSICAQTPTYDPPLGHKFAFRAIMFQGMSSGDELIMSMRITGCLELQDCKVNILECGRIGGVGRRRRDTVGNNTSANEVSEITKISFKVMMTNEESVRAKEKIDVNNIEYMGETTETLMPKTIVLVGTIGFIVLLISLCIFALYKFKLQQY